MAGIWKVLVLVAGLTVVFCAPRRRLGYEDIVNEAVRLYNDGQQGKPLFRLLEAIPAPRSNSTHRVLLNFRIKETVCTSGPGTQPQECAFREGGEERVCTGQFFRYRRLSLILSCDQHCGAPTEMPSSPHHCHSPLTTSGWDTGSALPCTPALPPIYLEPQAPVGDNQEHLNLRVPAWNNWRGRSAPRVRRSAGSSEDQPSEADLAKLPPAARDQYERAKYDIISNILSNF
ncbi:15 kDa protein B-like [Ctenodactylus gundi]